MTMTKKTAVFLRTPYNYDTNEASDESGLECKELSRTKQSEAEEADINTIVRRFNLTGQMPTNLRTPQYGDFDGIASFQDAMDRVRQAQENFMLIPADIRAKFGNDPGAFVEFAINPENLPELRKMGLARDIPVEATPVPTPPAKPQEDTTAPAAGPSAGGK